MLSSPEIACLDKLMDRLFCSCCDNGSSTPMRAEESAPQQENRTVASGMSNWKRTASVIVIIALLAGIAGYLLGINQSISQNTKSASSQSSAIVTALYSPTLTPDPTANWNDA